MGQIASAGTSVASVSTDLVIGGVLFFILFTAIAMMDKQRPFLAVALAFYPAVFLYQHFPFTSQIVIVSGDTMVYANKVVLFLVFLVLTTLVMLPMMKRHTPATGGSGTIRALLLTIVFLIEIALVVTWVIPIDGVAPLSTYIQSLFTEQYIFWWLIAPAAIPYFVTRI